MLPLLAWLATVGATPVFTNPMPMMPPAARRSSECAVRPDGGSLTDELLTYGGFNGATLTDVPYYRVLSNGWGSPLTSGMPPRERHAMAYDPESGLVGGGNGFTVFDTVILISAANTVTTPALPAMRPSARIDAALLWVPPLHQFLYFGGSANVLGTSHMNDLWSLEVADGGVNWKPTPASVGLPPSARGAACLVYHPERSQLILFGGETNGPSHVNDAWTLPLDGGAWVEETVTGAVPSVRAFAGCEWERTLTGVAPASAEVNKVLSLPPAHRGSTTALRTGQRPGASACQRPPPFPTQPNLERGKRASEARRVPKARREAAPNRARPER